MAALFCRAPCTGPEDQTLRAPVPWYQPIRNAVTRNPLEVVETNSGNDSPVSTLEVPVYPSISCSAPRLCSCQCGSPGSEFSGTGGFHGRGDAVSAAGWPDAAGRPKSFAAPDATPAATPAAARPRKARRLVFPSTPVSMPRMEVCMSGGRTIRDQYLRLGGLPSP